MAQFLSNVNLNGNEIQNVILQPLGTNPSTNVKAGRAFYNASEKRPSIYDGSKWQLLAFLADLEAITNGATDLDTRLKALEAYFSTEADSDTAVNKWNEIVAFLNAIEGDTLDSILANYALKTRKVSAGTGLTGGGDLSNDRTLSLAEVSGLTAGTYTKTTVDKYGRVTNGSNPNTLADMGITNAYTKEEVNSKIQEVAESATAVSYANGLGDNTTIGTLTIDGTANGILLRAANIIAALGYTPADSTAVTGVTKKYAGAITKSSSTSYTITHNLGTRDVIVQVYDPSSYEQVLVDVKMTDANKVTLTFASAPSANYRVVVIG